MKVKNLNASSKKTKNLIKETFAILMNEKKELNNITVTELVNKANITRSTFYTHYDNIYDVAKDFQNETLELLSKIKLNNIPTRPKRIPRAIIFRIKIPLKSPKAKAGYSIDFLPISSATLLAITLVKKEGINAE